MKIRHFRRLTQTAVQSTCLLGMSACYEPAGQLDADGSQLEPDVKSEALELAAGPCTTPTFSYYPGSPDSHLRYGRFDVHFEICNGVSPNGWHRSVPYANENATGNNTGFIIDGGNVTATTLADYYVFYEAVVPWKECIPKTSWCVSTGQFRVKYYAWVVEGKPGIIEQDISGLPSDATIFRTP